MSEKQVKKLRLRLRQAVKDRILLPEYLLRVYKQMKRERKWK